MSTTVRMRPLPLLLLLVVPATALAGIVEVAKCQKSIAREGARYAQRVIKSSLKCTQGVMECQLECENGVFGPPCETNPPPCCDPDDTGSNASFAACMAGADAVCQAETAKRAAYEATKVANMVRACVPLSQDELCGAQAAGLNFATMNAGCAALDPTYTCTLNNLINCIGGPLERQLLDQISFTLHPRAADAVAALNLQAEFPDIPVARKVRGDVAAGKVDVWTITGQAGDQIVARVNTKDDNLNNTSNLHPVLSFLGQGCTPVADTAVRNVACAVPNVCGSPCPQFKRTLPFSGTFGLAVQAVASGACTGGRYRLVVLSPSGSVPVLVADDVDPSSVSGATVGTCAVLAP
jgi:hypothetical protein